MTKAYVVNPKFIEDMWDIVEPYIIKSLNSGVNLDTTESVKQALIEERTFMIVATVEGKTLGCAVISFIDGATGRVASIDHLGGVEMHKWSKEMNEAINLLAKHEKCNYISALARPAWKKIWQDFENSGKILYIKEVKNEIN